MESDSPGTHWMWVTCKLFPRAPRPRSTNDEGEQIISGIVRDSDLPAEMKRLVSISLAQWSLRMRLISHAGAVEPLGLGLPPVYCVLPNQAPDGISGPQQNARGRLKLRGFPSAFGSCAAQLGQERRGTVRSYFLTWQISISSHGAPGL